MKKPIENEIEELFQELIVSKVKNDIDNLHKEIGTQFENFCEGINENINARPKGSAIKKIVDEPTRKILEVQDQLENEKILIEELQKENEDIYLYLQEQFKVPETEKLGAYLEKQYTILLEENKAIEKNVKEIITCEKEVLEKNIKQNNKGYLEAVNKLTKELQNNRKELSYIKQEITNEIEKYISNNECLFHEIEDKHKTVLNTLFDQLFGKIENVKQKQSETTSKCITIIKEINVVENSIKQQSKENKEKMLKMEADILKKIGTFQSTTETSLEEIKSSVIHVYKEQNIEYMREIEVQKKQIQFLMIGEVLSFLGIIALIFIQMI